MFVERYDQLHAITQAVIKELAPDGVEVLFPFILAGGGPLDLGLDRVAAPPPRDGLAARPRSPRPGPPCGDREPPVPTRVSVSGTTRTRRHINCPETFVMTTIPLPGRRRRSSRPRVLHARREHPSVIARPADAGAHPRHAGTGPRP